MRHKSKPEISEWLHAARIHLLDSGITPDEIELLKLRDGDGLTLAAIGKLKDRSVRTIHRRYAQVLRRLHHPNRIGMIPSCYK